MSSNFISSLMSNSMRNQCRRTECLVATTRKLHQVCKLLLQLVNSATNMLSMSFLHVDLSNGEPHSNPNRAKSTYLVNLLFDNPSKMMGII